jgi:hypothetical protein
VLTSNLTWVEASGRVEVATEWNAMAEQEAGPSAVVCSTCGYETSNVRGVKIHMTKKHTARLELTAELRPRKRARKSCDEDVGSRVAQSEVDVGGYEYGGQDDDHPMDTSAYEGEQSART